MYLNNDITDDIYMYDVREILREQLVWAFIFISSLEKYEKQLYFSLGTNELKLLRGDDYITKNAVALEKHPTKGKKWIFYFNTITRLINYCTIVCHYSNIITEYIEGAILSTAYKSNTSSANPLS